MKNHQQKKNCKINTSDESHEGILSNTKELNINKQKIALKKLIDSDTNQI